MLLGPALTGQVWLGLGLDLMDLGLDQPVTIKLDLVDSGLNRLGMTVLGPKNPKDPGVDLQTELAGWA